MDGVALVKQIIYWQYIILQPTALSKNPINKVVVNHIKQKPIQNSLS